MRVTWGARLAAAEVDGGGISEMSTERGVYAASTRPTTGRLRSVPAVDRTEDVPAANDQDNGDIHIDNFLDLNL